MSPVANGKTCTRAGLRTVVEKLGPYLWEVRTKVPNGIARVLFTVDGHTMILLHGFIKKTRKIPQKEINTARARLRQYQEEGS